MISYIENIATMLSISMILAWSLNIMVGYAGIFSVMHAVFYGVGAYVGAQYAIHVSAEFIVVAAVAMPATAAVAFLLTVPVLRVREEYFVVAAVGYQMVATTVFITWQSGTGGMGGLAGIPPATFFGVMLIDPRAYLALSAGCAVLCILGLNLLLRSPFGRALKALRDDETAAIALGKRPIRLRLVATSIAGGLAGLAGVLYAFYVSYINPESFTLDYSVLLLAMVIIGGAGTLIGPALGAIFITVFPALLNFLEVPNSILGPLQQVIYGSVIVMLMLFMPDGLYSAGRLLRKGTGKLAATLGVGGSSQ